MHTRHPPPFLLGLAAILSCLLMQAYGQEESPPGDDLVRCRQCDDKGKMACRSCEGKGKLYKTCPQCGGKGRRPCRQCNKPDAEEPNEAGPGRIACGYCGGDGKFGARDKRCPKCGGDGSYACPSCRGKGDHKCKTELPAGICPACRFTGKETCSTCYGKLWVRRKPEPVPTNPGRKETKDPETGQGGSTIDPETLLENIQMRFDSLVSIRSRETEIDTGELRRSCENGLIATRGFLERLERFKDKPAISQKPRDLYNEIRTAQKNMRALKGDLFDLDTLLLEFEKAYRRCEARMEDRPKSPFNTTKKKKDLGDWSEAIAFSLKGGEKLAGELAEGEVFLGGETSGKLEEDLNLFDNRIQAEEALAAAPAAIAKPGEAPTSEPGQPEAIPSQEGEKPSPGDATKGAEPESKVEEGEESRKNKPADEADPENRDSTGGGLLVGIMSGLAGALVGAGILFFYLRKKHYF